jgi:ABC-type cobalamin/Fe3+-siderophores transport system ATPase subunit
MRRMVVVEGPDGSGKSTLLEQLSRTFEVDVSHSGGPPKTEADWQEKLRTMWNLKWRADRGETVLVDRIPHISEPIYGGLAGRKFHDGIPLLDKELSELGPVIIYCKAISASFMHARISGEAKAHKPKSHLNWVLKNYPAIVAAYDRRINHLSGVVPIVRYSWPNETYENLLEKLKCAASS